MKLRILLLAAGLALTACSENQPESITTSLEYPSTVMVDHVDNYHGVEVADPYRWLEDDVRESTEVRSWVDAQNEVTFAYLNSIPERQLIEDRLTELWDYEKYGLHHA